MSERWRVLDCSAEGLEVTYRHSAVVVTSEDESVAVPLAEIAQVFFGVGSTVSSGLLVKLCEAGVAVTFLNWRGVPAGAAHGWSQHTRVAARHIAQSQLTAPRKKSAWAALVRAKIGSQAAVLWSVGSPAAPGLLALSKKVRSGDPQNVEAQAAKLYWKMLFDDGFHRLPQEGAGRNTLLDYGYGVLRGHVMRAVVAAGLCPALGVNHHRRDNMFNLADDIMEPFRCLVDYAVWQMPRDASLDDKAVKAALVGAARVPFLETGHSGVSHAQVLASRYGGYVEGAPERFTAESWCGVGQDQ